MQEADIKKLKVNELKKELQIRNLPCTGLKSALIERLLKAISDEEKTRTEVEEVKSTPTKEIKRKPSPDFGSTQEKKRAKLSKTSPDDSDFSNTGDAKAMFFIKYRDGPSAVQLETFANQGKELQFSSASLEVTNNGGGFYGGVSYCRANVTVSAGRWAYEIHIPYQCQIQLGWCTDSYNPGESDERDEGMWIFDSQLAQVQSPNGSVTKYGEVCGPGDIVGCCVNFTNRTIHYLKNGKEMGTAFSDIQNNSSLRPIIGVSRRGKCRANFGRDGLVFPQPGYYHLHSQCSEKDIRALGELFRKYRDLSNEGAVLDDEDNEHNSIHGAGFIQFSQDLGAEEYGMFVMMWQLRAEKIWEISRDEFMNGFPALGCISLQSIQNKLRAWEASLKTNDLLFKNFYNWVFDYLKDGKTVIVVDEAILTWTTIFSNRDWFLLPTFIQFLKETKKTSISRDTWQQLWYFANTYTKDVTGYSAEDSSWPLLFDDFVEWLKSDKSKENYPSLLQL